MFSRVILLAVMTASLCSWAVAGPPPAAADELHIIGPFVSGNLTVYLVRGPNLLGDKKYLTLAEALAQKKAVVREKQQVNELSVENLSDLDLYLQAGEIVKGGQQDRTLGRDMILSAHSGELPIGANCVEHGRWSQRGGEEESLFQSADNSLASKDVKRANYAQSQTGVWENVEKAQTKLAATEPSLRDAASAQAASPSSFELTLEDKGVTTSAEAYRRDLEKSSQGYTDLVGFFFATNGKLNSGDIYASPDLFNKMYPKLLHAAAVEALSEREANSDKKAYDAPKPQAVEAMIKAVDDAKADPQPLNAATVEDQINQQAHMPSASLNSDRTLIQVRQTDEMIMYESRDTQTKAPFVHRAYLTK